MKLWLAAGSAVMFLGVAFGAFGAHGLKSVLTQEMKAVYQTAVLYQLVHGLALLIIAAIAAHHELPHLNLAGGSFLIGVLLFSGSLYLLSITGMSRFGLITPFGGLAFLIGWGTLMVSALGHGHV